MPKRRFDLVASKKKLKGEMEDFYLDTKAWRKFKAGRPPLDWKKVKFHASSQGKLPDNPGLYVFTLELEYPSFPNHGYILYVGKTGADASTRTLKQRFADYLREKTSIRARPAVQYMLQNWEGDLTFYYTSIVNKQRISRLEDSLIEATKPLINRKFVDAELSKTMKAAFR